jgi:hypothetical protein
MARLTAVNVHAAKVTPKALLHLAMSGMTMLCVMCETGAPLSRCLLFAA